MGSTAQHLEPAKARFGRAGLCRAPRRRAFTLFELVLVMVIITAALAMVAPALRGFAHGAKMRDAATQFVAMCQWARTQAISTARIHRLQIDPNSAQYRVFIEDGDQFVAPTSDFGQVYQLPAGYRIELTRIDGLHSDYIDFLPTGRTDPARVLITTDNGEQSIVECATPAETFQIVPSAEVTR